MVTESEYKINGRYMGAVTYYGLSTDTKPVSAGNGSVFIEVDTQKGFFFDAENATWYPEPPAAEGGDAKKRGK